MTITERITALLNSMGDGPDKVADWLWRRGFRGKKAISCQCPVANAVKWHTGQGVFVYNYCALDGHDYPRSVKVPEPVFNFVNAFDAGHYPHLIAKDRPT
jgi:hypothetical protein